MKRTKARKQRADAKRAKAFRDAVWQRSFEIDYPMFADGSCAQCGIYLLRMRGTGHVHHLRGRNVAPEDRYNPQAAVLLCQQCHAAVHAGRIKL